MAEFVDSTVKDIDGRLRELQDEVKRLEAAKAALTGGSTATRRRPGRPRGSARPQPPPAGAPAAGPDARVAAAAERPVPTRRWNWLRTQPGITIPQIAEALKIEPNYLYRVMPKLVADGQVKREGQGWHPAS